VILVAGPIVLNPLQRSIAQQQQQPQQQQQTAYDAGKPIKDLSFEIDDVTFSHHTASVNGIQMHYVIGGQGNP
jgi:hypothetical protein